MEDLLSLMKSEYPALSPQFQQGARYLLDHQGEIATASMRKVALEAGVQPATLVRLSQHLGFDGWNGLRQIYVDELRSGAQPYAKRAKVVLKETRANQALVAMLDAQHRNLDNWLRSNADTLPKAVELLYKARSVHVAAFRACFPIAFTFHYVYRLFRPSVHLIRGDAGMLEMELRGFGKGDTVFVTSFAPYSQEIIRVATAARKGGANILALTDSAAAPIALDADCVLLFSQESPSFFPSVTAGVAVAESLCQLLLVRTGGRAVRALEATEGQLRDTGAYVPAR
ncbi:MurR/RpiR family transcriptional regulator [Burkholderia pyrrocinia]|uniref:MurR/RpiR family transcriptional regulator n=1 Tax=Burkholderia pyrrocinia TaxID=60550 RepID=A0ABZ3BUR7_BURPY